jgi:hypothetical protein
MKTRKRNMRSKARNKTTNRKLAVSKAGGRPPRRIATAARKRVTARGPLEYAVAQEPSVTVYELVETEVYRETSPEADSAEEEFGT